MAGRKKIIVIGSGFAGLSAAAVLAKDGHEVTILEKNEQVGGRARIWQQNGFTFDMGPSWYWMPEVFEQYYNLFGKTTSDFYDLKRLDPSYRIYFSGNDQIDVPASLDDLVKLFEAREKGSGRELKIFLKDAEYKYRTAINDYVFRISNSITEYFDFNLLIKSFRLKLFQNLRSEVRAKFKHPSLVSLLEFPVLFLGSSPDKIPAMYSMMNYADLVLGTWYPMGGMHQIVKAMQKIAEEQGVRILTNQEVKQIQVINKKAKNVITGKGSFEADIIVAGSDYHHTEQHLLAPEHRTYSESYWDSRSLSPSCLLFFIGLSKKLPSLLHHNLFFDKDFEQHSDEIYQSPRWPTDPLFYVCAPSKTDNSVAPEGMENLFVLIPIASGLNDSESLRKKYFDKIMARLEEKTGEQIRENIVVDKSYCLKDFKSDYHSYKGNAYGLSNTLMQTAVLKPKAVSQKVNNLFYTGQLTVPGPGVPPSIISGRIVAGEVVRRIKNNTL